MANRDLKRITGLFAFEWYDDGVLKLIKISCTNKSIHRRASCTSARRTVKVARRDRRLCVMPLTFWLHFKTKAPTIRIFIAPFPGDLLWPFSLPPLPSFCSLRRRRWLNVRRSVCRGAARRPAYPASFFCSNWKRPMYFKYIAVNISFY